MQIYLKTFYATYIEYIINRLQIVINSNNTYIVDENIVIA